MQDSRSIVGSYKHVHQYYNLGLQDYPLKIHGYFGTKPLKTTLSEKKTNNYFLTSNFVDLTIQQNTRFTYVLPVQVSSLSSYALRIL
jgi:hypothetical protein